ncbi:MAG: MerR family transcriptional regulator [Desulfovibrionaceae bacterium]
MSELGQFKRYRIGKAAKILDVKTSVLRFWESEFPQLDPVRTESGQRLYTAEHMELLKRIKQLLYNEGLTIEGARKRLEEGEETSSPSVSDSSDRFFLREVASELRAILGLFKA